MVLLSVPVIIEKMAFSFGKVVVNSMCTIYSPLTVGALGISNNLGGITTNPQNGFQEGGSAIISQSLGAGLPKRALEAFRCILIINMAIGAVLMSLTLIFLGSISRLFSGGDPQFQQMICSIYQMEAFRLHSPWYQCGCYGSALRIWQDKDFPYHQFQPCIYLPCTCTVGSAAVHGPWRYQRRNRHGREQYCHRRSGRHRRLDHHPAD